MDDDIGGIFCVCWMIPFFATALCLSVAHQIQASWRARKIPDNDPHCAKCGYNLRGLTTMRCSECGSGLGKNTVLFRADKPPFTLGARLLIWTTFMPGPALIFYMLVLAIWPMSYLTTWNGTLEYAVGSKAITVDLTAEQRGDADPKKPEHAVLTLIDQTGSSPTRLQIEFDQQMNQIAWGKNPDQTGNVDPEGFEQALKHFKVLPVRIIERAELATLMSEMLQECRIDPDGESYAAASSWNRQIYHYQEATNRRISESMTLIISILLGGFAWLWGMHWVSQTFKRDMENYTRQRELLFTRFHEHVERNAKTFENSQVKSDG